MKKSITFLFMTIFAINVMAQQEITKFLGIPIDGFKSQMKQKLIAKGFRQTSEPGYDFLEGEFNGHDVNLHIVTNNNIVYRIMVADAKTCNEANIKTRFNILVSQFENNGKYFNLDGDQTIADDVNIYYEMKVHNKNFDAIFYQKPEKECETIDEIANISSNKVVWFRIMEVYGEYYISMFYDNIYNKANGEDL